MRAPGIVYRSQAFGRAVKLPGPFWERGRPIGMGPGDRGPGDPGRDGAEGLIEAGGWIVDCRTGEELLERLRHARGT